MGCIWSELYGVLGHDTVHFSYESRHSTLHAYHKAQTNQVPYTSHLHSNYQSKLQKKITCDTVFDNDITSPNLFPVISNSAVIRCVSTKAIIQTPPTRKGRGSAQRTSEEMKSTSTVWKQSRRSHKSHVVWTRQLNRVRVVISGTKAMPVKVDFRDTETSRLSPARNKLSHCQQQMSM